MKVVFSPVSTPQCLVLNILKGEEFNIGNLLEQFGKLLNVDIPALSDLGIQASVEAFVFPLQVIGSFVGVLWLLECFDVFIFRGRLDRFGIYPRKMKGLMGIIFSPLLHGDFQHLAANTMPLLILGGLIILFDFQVFVAVTFIIWLVSGVGVWLIGRPRSLHIGISGIVFGYLGFLFARAYFEGSPIAIALAIIAGLLFGGLIWGILPSRRRQSWESHFCGVLGGGLAAHFLPEIKQWMLAYAPF